MGTKVNKNFEDFFFPQINAKDFSFCVKNNIFILSLRGQSCFGITIVYSFRKKDGSGETLLVNVGIPLRWGVQKLTFVEM